MSETVDIERVDHIGIRVRDLDRALAFLPDPRVHTRAPGNRQ